MCSWALIFETPIKGIKAITNVGGNIIIEAIIKANGSPSAHTATVEIPVIVMPRLIIALFLILLKNER